MRPFSLAITCARWLRLRTQLRANGVAAKNLKILRVDVDLQAEIDRNVGEINNG
jgi:hypothetical protein